MLVGARSNDGVGATYLFSLDVAARFSRLEDKIVAPGVLAGDNFGVSVVLSGSRVHRKRYL